MYRKKYRYLLVSHEGNPSSEFWKSIAITYRSEDIRGAGCIPDPDGETMVDGWFMKLFTHINTLELKLINIVAIPEWINHRYVHHQRQDDTKVQDLEKFLPG